MIGTSAAAGVDNVGIRDLRVVTVPNPSRSARKVILDLPRDGVVRLEVYDVAGRLVARLSEGMARSGVHCFTWDGRDLDGNACLPGVYFCRAEAGGRVRAVRLVVLGR